MTPTILQKILATKKVEMARATVPLEDLQAQARDQSPPRGFTSALAKSTDVALIAEIKKASPSEGVIRADFDPAEIARAYSRAGATALSVLTDVDYFQGSLENLPLARNAVPLPCLRKDFLYDPYQVWEARAHGADAILIILAMLSDDEARPLLKLAQELGMDTLVETHSEDEVDRALALNAPLVGVNARNLSTFKTDLSVAETLIPKLVAEGRLVVAESALKTRADIDRMAAAGAKAVLIGTSFMREDDVEAAVRRMMGATSETARRSS